MTNFRQMNKLVRRCLTLVLWLYASTTMFAQIVTEYNCDFEDSSQDSEWILNPGTYASTIPHEWAIGQTDNNTINGSRALYVTTDKVNHSKTDYSSTPSTVVAYTNIQLAPASGYVLSFDWKAFGDGNNGQYDYLYVAMVDENDPISNIPIDLASTTTADLSSVIKSYGILKLNPGEEGLRGTSYWQNCTLTIPARYTDGTNKRLVFIWVCYGSPTRNPGACLDNIMIKDPTGCPSPTGLSMEILEDMDGVRLTWNKQEGVTDYKLTYITYTDGKETEIDVNDTTVLLTRLAEGQVMFRLVAVCDQYHSSLPTVISGLVYNKSAYCIDYLNLNDTICYTGIASTTEVDDKGGKYYDPNFWKQGRVDSEVHSQEYGQHVLYVDTTETDPNTGHRLRCVPQGALASVRIGNSAVTGQKGGEAAQIRIPYHVDATNDILILKYAIVLDDPGSALSQGFQHSKDQIPRFTLKVVDKTRSLVDQCSYGDFDTDAASTSGWNKHNNIFWKDWQIVGMNLSDHHGEDVTVEVSVFDCTEGAHFGYVYFVLECTSAKIQGANCGEINTELEAIPGFTYKWYKASDPNTILSTDRVYHVQPDDTEQYMVEMTYNENCSFYMYASSVPYLPQAKADYSYQPKDCQNIVSFTDESYIILRNQNTGEEIPTNDQADYIEWDFGDGTTSLEKNPEHIFPESGGVYVVKQTAYVENCQSEQTYTILIPKIGAVDTTFNEIACSQGGYTYKGTTYWESTVIKDYLSTKAGCDSTVTIGLTIVDSVQTFIKDTILDDTTYPFLTENGVIQLNEGGNYVSRLQTKDGCDSTIYLQLYVHGVLRVDMENNFSVCADEPYIYLPYRVTHGSTDSYSLQFINTDLLESVYDVSLNNENDIVVNLPQPMVPNNYNAKLIFHDKLSGDVEIPINIAVNYSDTILVQKWNDVIGIRNTEHNGGYTFTQFQWYKATEPIEGATNEYLYIGGGTLEEGVPYYVKLSRVESDGSLIVLNTCPIYPITKVEDFSFPSIVGTHQKVKAYLPKQAQLRFVSLDGRVNQWQEMDEGSTFIQTPSSEGLFVLQVLYSDGQKEQKKVWVRE